MLLTERLRYPVIYANLQMLILQHTGQFITLPFLLKKQEIHSVSLFPVTLA
jgi:hypothetical protein